MQRTEREQACKSDYGFFSHSREPLRSNASKSDRRIRSSFRCRKAGRWPSRIHLRSVASLQSSMAAAYVTRTKRSPTESIELGWYTSTILRPSAILRAEIFDRLHTAQMYFFARIPCRKNVSVHWIDVYLAIYLKLASNCEKYCLTLQHVLLQAWFACSATPRALESVGWRLHFPANPHEGRTSMRTTKKSISKPLTAREAAAIHSLRQTLALEFRIFANEQIAMTAAGLGWTVKRVQQTLAAEVK